MWPTPSFYHTACNSIPVKFLFSSRGPCGDQTFCLSYTPCTVPLEIRFPWGSFLVRADRLAMWATLSPYHTFSNFIPREVPFLVRGNRFAIKPSMRATPSSYRPSWNLISAGPCFCWRTPFLSKFLHVNYSHSLYTSTCMYILYIYMLFYYIISYHIISYYVISYHIIS